MEKKKKKKENNAFAFRFENHPPIPWHITSNKYTRIKVVILTFSFAVRLWKKRKKKKIKTDSVFS